MSDHIDTAVMAVGCLLRVVSHCSQDCCHQFFEDERVHVRQNIGDELVCLALHFVDEWDGILLVLALIGRLPA